jgi:hypothetical protein
LGGDEDRFVPRGANAVERDFEGLTGLRRVWSGIPYEREVRSGLLGPGKGVRRRLQFPSRCITVLAHLPKRSVSRFSIEVFDEVYPRRFSFDSLPALDPFT